MFNEHILIQMFLFYFMLCSLFLGAGCKKCWSKKQWQLQRWQR